MRVLLFIFEDMDKRSVTELLRHTGQDRSPNFAHSKGT